MTALEIVYVASFFLGLAYAIFATLMGGSHFGGGADAPAVDAGHPEPGGGPDSGMVEFSPLSPVVIAMFVTAFGATGMICLKAFATAPFVSLVIAVLAGFAVAAITFILFVFLFRFTQSSSEPNLLSAVGQEAEVITPIPAQGVGEIAYVAKGARYTAPAQSSQKIEIQTHRVVRIEKIVGNTCHVRPAEPEKP